jgi:membrane protein implicated in regulation of membrane protease activity
MVVAWLAVAVALVFFELHNVAFYALFGAVGCLAAVGVAVIDPSAIALQAGVAVAVAAVGVAGVRPLVSKAFETRHSGPVVRGVHGGLVGQQAITLDEVGDEHHPGHLRMAGERWLAVNGGDGPIPPGATVVVTAVRGTTLTVLRIDEIGMDDSPNGGDGGTR